MESLPRSYLQTSCRDSPGRTQAGPAKPSISRQLTEVSRQARARVLPAPHSPPVMAGLGWLDGEPPRIEGRRQAHP